MPEERDVQRCLDDLDTPALVIEMSKLESNLSSMQELADDLCVQLRPHVKTHKMPWLAKVQCRTGARGIATAKVSEAEVMAGSGVHDIQIANEVVGEIKLERLAKLNESNTVQCAVDSEEGAKLLSKRFAEEDKEIRALIEIDSGLGRAGLRSPAKVLTLANLLARSRGVCFAGIMTHAGHVYSASSKDEVRSIGLNEGRTMVKVADHLRDKGIEVEVVSVGSTPTVRYSGSVKGVTEIRPGNYVFNDLNQVALGAAALEDCALTVLSTVMSIPAHDRVIIDAGSKALSAEVGAHGSRLVEGYGHVIDKDRRLFRLSEEHGSIEGRSDQFSLGERIRIIPNHACACVNLFDRAYLVSGDEVLDFIEISARGKSQ